MLSADLIESYSIGAPEHPAIWESRVRYVDVGVSDILSMELEVSTEQGISSQVKFC